MSMTGIDYGAIRKAAGDAGADAATGMRLSTTNHPKTPDREISW